jgi:hypothetical protein
LRNILSKINDYVETDEILECIYMKDITTNKDSRDFVDLKNKRSKKSEFNSYNIEQGNDTLDSSMLNFIKTSLLNKNGLMESEENLNKLREEIDICITNIIYNNDNNIITITSYKSHWI